METTAPDCTRPPSRFSAFLSVRGHRWRQAGLAVSLFFIVLGANWAVFERFGSDIPDMDQWDAEGVYLFAPWFQHDHFLAHLFHPHNEHRVVVTKLQSLALLLAGGQWDSRVESLFNDLIRSFIALGLWLFARRSCEGPWRAPAFLAIVALYALPLSWQNLLAAFHSQQYWLIALSFVAIVNLPWARSWSGRWWLGTIAATLALGTMGSGCFAAAVVFGILLCRLVAREISGRNAWPTLVVSAALVAVGVATRVEVDYHEALKAKTAHDFVLDLLRNLEWPVVGHDWIGVVVWMPWLIVTFIALKSLRDRARRAPAAAPTVEPSLPPRLALTLFALGGWVGLQLLATAYARGAGGQYPASRYMDTLMFGAAVNAIALATMLSRARRPQRPGEIRAAIGAQLPVLSGIALAWVVVVGSGLMTLTRDNLRGELPAAKEYYDGAGEHLRAYLATTDPAELIDPIPYLNPPAMIERLALPGVRDLMPSSVRPPLPLAGAAPAAPLRQRPNAVRSPASNPSPAFEYNQATYGHWAKARRDGLSPQTPPLNARPTWGSFNAAGPTNVGTWHSTPLTPSRFGWLRFETAGDAGEPGVALELRDASTNALIATVRPSKTPHDSWRSAYVRAPRRPFVIVASDNDPTRWIAFSAPVEMSSLSYWAWRLMKEGLLLAELAAACAFLLAVLPARTDA